MRQLVSTGTRSTPLSVSIKSHGQKDRPYEVSRKTKRARVPWRYVRLSTFRVFHFTTSYAYYGMNIKNQLPSVYVETSIVSYRSARDSSSLLGAAHQLVTRRWWDRRNLYRCFVSDVVIRECRAGDPAAALRRLDSIREFPSLAIDDKAIEIAENPAGAGHCSEERSGRCFACCNCHRSFYGFLADLELSPYRQSGDSSTNGRTSRKHWAAATFRLYTGRTSRRRK